MTTLSQSRMLHRIAKLLECEPDAVEQRIIDLLDELRIVGELRDMESEAVA